MNLRFLPGKTSVGVKSKADEFNTSYYQTTQELLGLIESKKT
jgi:hypothetical protein